MATALWNRSYEICSDAIDDGIPIEQVPILFFQMLDEFLWIRGARHKKLEKITNAAMEKFAEFKKLLIHFIEKYNPKINYKDSRDKNYPFLERLTKGNFNGNFNFLIEFLEVYLNVKDSEMDIINFDENAKVPEENPLFQLFQGNFMIHQYYKKVAIFLALHGLQIPEPTKRENTIPFPESESYRASLIRKEMETKTKAERFRILTECLPKISSGPLSVIVSYTPYRVQEIYQLCKEKMDATDTSKPASS